jgi:hypothetical protein
MDMEWVFPMKEPRLAAVGGGGGVEIDGMVAADVDIHAS